MKKKFLPAYDLPRLVQGQREWYILLRYQKDGIVVRRRPTFNLNRIRDLNDRERRGHELVGKLTWWFQQKKDPEDFDEMKVPVLTWSAPSQERPAKYDTPIVKAIEIARDIKCSTGREQTIACYSSICNLFLLFIRNKKLTVLKVGDVRKEHAVDYLDHCAVERKVGARTWNNNLRDMKVIFNLLIDRGYIQENPFNGIKYKPNPTKKRRPFTPEEAQAVVDVAKEKDRLLFYGILLQYACLVRPAELRRIRFKNISIAHGTVYVGADEEKTHRAKTCTIPNKLRPLFVDPFWTKFPSNYLIFGANWAPHPNKACGEREMNRRHRLILKKLRKEGKLASIDGLSWYSWKDTGITHIIHAIGVESARAQANHRTEEMTRRYYHEPKINEKMRGFESDLF